MKIAEIAEGASELVSMVRFIGSCLPCSEQTVPQQNRNFSQKRGCHRRKNVAATCPHFMLPHHVIWWVPAFKILY